MKINFDLKPTELIIIKEYGSEICPIEACERTEAVYRFARNMESLLNHRDDMLQQWHRRGSLAANMDKIVELEKGYNKAIRDFIENKPGVSIPGKFINFD